jgi:hypothetical protein
MRRGTYKFRGLPGGTAGAVHHGAAMQSADKSRAIKILARSIYKDLEAQGFDGKQIVSLATELISEVTTRMASTSRDSATQLPQQRRA